MIATCTRGSELTSRPLPSFVTRQIEPVSATPKFAPVMPTSAVEERLAELACAPRCVSASSSGGTALALDRARAARRPRSAVFSIAGAMMCTGCSPASWRMYSPRSVSTGVDAGRLERLVQADLLGRHRLRLRRELRARVAADVRDVRARLLGGAREVDVPAARLERGREPRRRAPSRSSITAIRISCARSRSSSTSGELRPGADAGACAAGRSTRRAPPGCARRRACRARSRGTAARAARAQPRDAPRERGREVDDARAADLLRAAAQVHQAARVGGDDRVAPPRRRRACRRPSPARPRAGAPRTSRRTRSRGRAARTGRAPRPTPPSSRRGSRRDARARAACGTSRGRRPGARRSAAAAGSPAWTRNADSSQTSNGSTPTSSGR